MKTLKQFARRMKHHVQALYLAGRDSRTPLITKCLVGFIVAYALSPIDLIPDFIPLIGFLDDALILPVGIYLAVRSLPAEVWNDCLAQAEQAPVRLPNSRWAAAAVLSIWVMAAVALVYWLRG